MKQSRSALASSAAAVARRHRLELEIELDVELDECVTPVFGAFRHLPETAASRRSRSPRGRSGTAGSERAAHEAGENQVLRRPRRVEVERRVSVGRDPARAIERDGVAEFLRPGSHSPILPGMRRNRPDGGVLFVHAKTAALSEAECYARCYGGWDETVRIVRLEPRRARRELGIEGEALRVRFEEFLEARDPAELAEPEAA
jgi:hypothetical protein